VEAGPTGFELPFQQSLQGVIVCGNGSARYGGLCLLLPLEGGSQECVPAFPSLRLSSDEEPAAMVDVG
jgi:hypothetical protein